MVVAWHWLSDPQAKLSNEQAANRRVNTTRESFMVFLVEKLMVRAVVMEQCPLITK